MDYKPEPEPEPEGEPEPEPEGEPEPKWKRIRVDYFIKIKKLIVPIQQTLTVTEKTEIK